MKCKIIIGLLLVSGFAYAEDPVYGPPEENSRSTNKREIVRGIAEKQGIDMKTREGKRMMAQYLRKSGQENLLPPRHQRKSDSGSSEEGEHCQKRKRRGGDGERGQRMKPRRDSDSY